jgi:hypothetical protein
MGMLLSAAAYEREENLLLIDNYGGLTATARPLIGHSSSGHWYLETAAVVSSWNRDGTVQSRPHLQLNGSARGCYVGGAMDVVLPLGPRR